MEFFIGLYLEHPVEVGLEILMVTLPLQLPASVAWGRRGRVLEGWEIAGGLFLRTCRAAGWRC